MGWKVTLPDSMLPRAPASAPVDESHRRIIVTAIPPAATPMLGSYSITVFESHTALMVVRGVLR
jgi:hypothetical protein